MLQVESKVRSKKDFTATEEQARREPSVNNGRKCSERVYIWFESLETSREF